MIIRRYPNHSWVLDTELWIKPLPTEIKTIIALKKISHLIGFPFLLSPKVPQNQASPIPPWAKPDSDEPPPWAQNEGKKDDSHEGFEIPFFVHLLASAITAIAAIGSVFEYVNKKPVFGILSSDSIFYAPVLGFFAFTGIPTSAFLWFKSVQTANKEAEEQDKRDGYR